LRLWRRAASPSRNPSPAPAELKGHSDESFFERAGRRPGRLAGLGARLAASVVLDVKLTPITVPIHLHQKSTGDIISTDPLFGATREILPSASAGEPAQALHRLRV
jgi:hypothetical protein